MQRYVAALTACDSFEDAAAVALRAMLGRCDEALAAAGLAPRARMLRGMAHVRPDDASRQLVTVEHATAPGASAGAPPGPYLPSATVWRLVAQRRCAVAVDVALGAITPQGAGADTVADDEPAESFGSDESRRRLLDRETTHAYVLPLRAQGGAPQGVLTLEAHCPSAIGREFVWASCAGELELLADVAAPRLTALPSRVAPPDAAVDAGDPLLPVVGPSTAPLVAALRVFAQQDETVLISGATGTGKSRLARWCHAHSPRRGHPFESVDLLAVPEDLQMAELFGWRKGAFTGAVKDQPGGVARAGRGTLFVDEIDKLSLKAQAGLLRVLEERRYRPLGEGAGEHRAEARFVVGTNANLREAVRAGRFREDLYYRINVLPVRLPPLSERRDETAAWARYMARRRHAEGDGVGTVLLSPAAERLLAAHDWPGNLRELDNIVRRSYALALMDRRGPGADLVLEEDHARRALAYESAADPAAAIELLRRAAAALVLEARERAATVDLDLTDAFRGFVLAAAIELSGDRDAAFRLVGREAMLRDRNHHKVLRREIERVEALHRALGRPLGSPFRELLAAEKRARS